MGMVGQRRARQKFELQKPSNSRSKRFIIKTINPERAIEIMAKPPSKAQIKTDNAIANALQDLGNVQGPTFNGFQRFHHQANYTNFPASLMITCVYDSIVNAETAETEQRAQIAKLIQAKLLRVGIRFKKLDNQIMIDSEEACHNEHQGDWGQRFEARSERAVVKKRPAALPH